MARLFFQKLSQYKNVTYIGQIVTIGYIRMIQQFQKKPEKMRRLQNIVTFTFVSYYI